MIRTARCKELFIINEFYGGDQVRESELLELLGALEECAQNKADLKALITVLCDALEEEFGEVRPDLVNKRPWDLIQRAREATK
jgi:hypothetical protein